ncbi:MAG: type II secretion system F family protein [bacterium]
MPQLSASEYRIQATDQSGRTLQRFITATSLFAARDRAKSLAKTNGWIVNSIKRKRIYTYKVRRGANTIEGTQSAYSREEVTSALKKLGFEIKSVRRFYDIKFAASSQEIVTFIGTSAKLLEQKIPYNEILHIMAGNVRDRQLKGALKAIIKDLKEGLDSREAFLRQGKVIGYDTALMLGIASKSGDMKSIFESVARFVEREADFKKGLVSSMILPAVTGLALVGALAFYVLFILPRMIELLGPMIDTLPPLTMYTLEFADFVKEHYILLTLAFVSMLVAFYSWLATETGRVTFHRFIVNVPYIGRIMRNTSVEMFCRVLGIMYTSGENIDAIQHAAEASRNAYFEKQIKTVAVPTMLKYGTEFAKAMEMTAFFPDAAVSRFRTASETGTVKSSAVQLADYYEMENRYAMKNLVNLIEVFISILIMASMVFLTMLSSETASIKIEPKQKTEQAAPEKDTILWRIPK